MRGIFHLFGQLADEDTDWLARVGRPRSIGTGEHVILAGREVGAIYIVLEGRLAVETAHGVVSNLQAGDIVGEMSLVDSRPTSADVRAAEPSRVLEVDKRRLMSQLATDDGFAARFYRGVAMSLSDRLRALQGGPNTDPDEINPELLDTLHLGGDRFQRLVRALQPM